MSLGAHVAVAREDVHAREGGADHEEQHSGELKTRDPDGVAGVVGRVAHEGDGAPEDDTQYGARDPVDLGGANDDDDPDHHVDRQTFEDILHSPCITRTSAPESGALAPRWCVQIC